MSATFTIVPFADAGRAAANLAQVEKLLPASLFLRLPGLLAQLPDPDGALNFLERFLRHDSPDAHLAANANSPGGGKSSAHGTPPEGGQSGGDGAAKANLLARVLQHLLNYPPALHYLLVIFAHSRFLSETLIQQPELLIWLDRPGARIALDRAKSPEDLDEEFARFSTTAFDATPSVILARYKRREYLRIVLRDILGLATLSDTTSEISLLADVLLSRALRIASQKLEEGYGTPQFLEAAGRQQHAGLTVLSLGKLGAQELNYNSDVDLMFLYSADGESSGGRTGSLTNAEFFVRLAQATLKIITEATPDGAVFRVDLRLRPQGAEGDLAVSLPSAVDYYSTRAREWELQMLIKARPSAGEIETGRLFLRRIEPLIYRPGINLDAVEAVLNAREEITRKLHRRAAVLAAPMSGTAAEGGADHSALWNVKLSPGGIRDIEFLTQCLQRVYGGADPWLRHPATLVALQRLHDKGHLSGHDFFRLGAAYQFLRRVEHRLQLRDGLQRHTLPEDPGALDRLARRCGIDPPGPLAQMNARDLLLERIAGHFEEVREIYERILSPLHEQHTAAAKTSDALPGTTGFSAPPEAGFFASEEESGSLPRVRREFPAVASVIEEFNRSTDAYARRGLNNYLSSALLDAALMRKIEAHPEILARAAELLSRSDLAVEMLSRNPDEIFVIADTGHQAAEGHGTASSSRMRGRASDTLESIRVSYRRQVLAAIARALLAGPEGGEPFATYTALTRLAENALVSVFRFAFSELHPADRGGAQITDLAAAPFAVIALGRLGTGEFDIGSDADLVFIVDDALTPEQREPWRRLGERYVHLVSAHTRDGLLFPVDTRLRPHGRQSDLSHSPSQLREYFAGDAQAWEAASFLKARPIAGNFALASQAIQSVFTGFTARTQMQADPRAALREELIEMRRRLEEDTTDPVFPWTHATPTVRHPAELKKDPGGFFDIEYILAYVCLSMLLNEARALKKWDSPLAEVTFPASAFGEAGEGAASASSHLKSTATFDYLSVTQQISPEQAAQLKSAALLYRSIDHAARLITGRATHRLPEPSLASRIARLLSQWGIPIAPELSSAVGASLESTRGLFDALFRTGG